MDYYLVTIAPTMIVADNEQQAVERMQECLDRVGYPFPKGSIKAVSALLDTS